MTDAIRLSKRLAEQLPCSRREAELYIEGGWVRVDGETVETPGARVAPHQQVGLAPNARAEPIAPATLLVHKPAGAAAEPLLRPERLCTEGGPPQRLLQAHLRALHCVAPLPLAASGLVVYTQDARVARKLLEGGVEHECLAEVAGTLAANGLQALRPFKASWQSERRLRLAFLGGREEEIAPQCAAVGLQLQALRRLRLGRISLAKLPEGQWRYLLPWERF